MSLSPDYEEISLRQDNVPKTSWYIRRNYYYFFDNYIRTLIMCCPWTVVIEEGQKKIINFLYTKILDMVQLSKKNKWIK